ncbi:carbohydrate sulfotransferase 11-like [Haliotis cracherodii]|uniref:carbohydrate sulfotransferase 11-like n=1 Tax=Haliotis cracherodii TaxID=6455 RepID=UPI0039E77682
MDPLETEYEARLQRYRDACTVRKTRTSVYHNMYYYADGGTNTSMAYCPVPKVGCTFWRRIFMFLNKTRSQSQISSPFDISRFEVYFKPMIHLTATKYATDVLEHAQRFLFARDPYARLFSAYVDKFLLPQFLGWERYGKVVTAARAGTRNVNETCVKTLVTFPEFVNITMSLKYRDPHWLPIASICDPCRLFPHFIGKQESFSKDAKYILNKVGLGNLLKKYSHKTFISDEITQMVDFTYAYRDFNVNLRKCFDSLLLAERLWTAFKINGYLRPEAEFPKEELSGLIRKTNDTRTIKAILTQLIAKENKQSHMSRVMYKLQKRTMMLNEYKNLSRETMEKIAKYYTWDFKIFGYEQYPAALFPWKHQ